jgi:hypothetical protein
MPDNSLSLVVLAGVLIDLLKLLKGSNTGPTQNAIFV